MNTTTRTACDKARPVGSTGLFVAAIAAALLTASGASAQTYDDMLKQRAKDSANLPENRSYQADPVGINPAATPAAQEELKSDLPKLVWENDSHDFGVVKDQVELVCKFKFRNTGKRPLVIEKVNTGCGCAAAQLPKNEYAPGETGEIEITYNPKGQGRASRSIQVLTNDPEQRSATLTISANIVPVVSAEPTSIQFGQVNVGEVRELEVMILSRDPNMEIVGFEATGSEIEARLVNNPDRKGPGGDLPGYAVLSVKLKDNVPVGRLLRLLTVRVKAADGNGGMATEHSLRINCFAAIRGELAVQPPFLRFPPLKAGEVFERELLLTRSTDKPFKILSMTPVNSTLPVTVRHEPAASGSGYRIIVSGTAPANPTNFRGSLQIETDIEREKQTEVQFSGIVRAQ